MKKLISRKKHKAEMIKWKRTADTLFRQVELFEVENRELKRQLESMRQVASAFQIQAHNEINKNKNRIYLDLTTVDDRYRG